MRDDDIGGYEPNYDTLHRKLILYVLCSNRCQIMTFWGVRGVSQIMTVDDIGGGGVAYLVSQ